MPELSIIDMTGKVELIAEDYEYDPERCLRVCVNVVGLPGLVTNAYLDEDRARSLIGFLRRWLDAGKV